MSEPKPDEVSYPSYLALDELLFIIVHQASEL